MKTKPLVTFRVYPENRSLYAIVNIWPTKKAMYAHRPLQRNHEAVCTGTTLYYMPPKRSGKPNRKAGLFAELNFHRKFLGIGCVSHEFTHAAFSWANRVNLPIQEIKEMPLSSMKHGVLPQDGPEERFCYALGEMVKQFTERAYKLGIYK